jgi:hypothetical protein
MTTVRFKENASTARPNLGLEKEGRSKFPGCVDLIQPAIGRDGRWKTGMDDLAYSVLSIRNSEERTALQEKLRRERKEIEELTGLNLDARSEFWDTYLVEVNGNTVLDLTNPLHRIKYHVLLASDDVAPSLKETFNVDYLYAKYYVAREFEEVQDEMSKKMRYNDAIYAMKDLLKTPDKALLIGQYLDLNIKATTPPDNVYALFQNFIDQDEKLGSIDRFTHALELSPEEINIKLIYADAIRFNVIRLRDGLYQRGNITLGRTPGEVIKFLEDVKNSSELLSIQEEVEMKKKFG